LRKGIFMFNLKGKVAVVTGGAGHLGRAISEVLAEFGANLVVASRNLKKCEELASNLSQEYEIDARGIELDTRSIDSVTHCMDVVQGKMGSIDILVNNAASGKTNISIETVSEEDWLEGIEGTVNGVFRCTKAVIPYMRGKKCGVIINISSMYGIVSPDYRIYGNTGYNNPPDYGAGKAAIIQFTRYAACHLATYGIRVNAISPGSFPSRDVQQNKSFISKLENRIPLGRIGQPNDLKGAVIFLASDASGYITGQNIIVDGGWTVW
jgi:NAD(P)-dependent dehydrogenase (short-subunit alcohol dehydrogenase family)